MKLNVVISTLNSQYIHSSLAPWCLLTGIKSYCNEEVFACVCEGTINEKIEDVANRILEKSPQVLGCCCYIWNITEIYRLIELVKNALPEIVIILGGPEVSYNADAVLENHQNVDYILSGEGEKPFALFLNALSHKAKLEGIPGLCYRNNGDIIVSQPHLSKEEPPSPYTPEYFEALNGRISYLETSRGCPYSCAFCLSGRCGNARFFDIDHAKKDLLVLANSGTQTVKLVDRTFNANRKRAFALFQYILENYGKTIPNGVCFHFEIAGDILDEETINLLATVPVGAMQLEIGLQSFHPDTLESIQRKTNITLLKNNIKKLIHTGNIHIHIDLIAGLPQEDLESFAKSFNTAYLLKPNMLQLGFLKLLHGAPMREKSDDFPCEYSKNPPYEVLSTPWMTSEELIVVHKIEDALERLYNSGRFRRTLDYLIFDCEYEPFELFFLFGTYASEKGTRNLSLDAYTTLVYDFFSTQQRVDSLLLRDVMVCDRLSTIATGLLPDILRIKDPLLREIKKALNSNPLTRQPMGVKRGMSILYSENCAVYVDYQEKNPITGEYTLVKVSMKGLLYENID